MTETIGKDMLRSLTTAGLVGLLPQAVLANEHVSGDAEAGAKVFRKCEACHAVGSEAQNKAGPALNGIVYRKIAAGADYGYSDALAALGAEGKTWTPEELSAFLQKPRDYAKGTRMTFVGLRKEADRDDVIAYLATFSEEEN